MELDGSTVGNLPTETVNSLENPHINPETSRRKGRKRSANGNIDHRSQQRRRLDGESSSSSSQSGANGLTRTASEEIMSRPKNGANTGDIDPEGKPEAPAEESGDVDTAAGEDLPTPDQIAPFAEFMVDEDGKPLSKNQQKKRRKQAEWEAKRDDRKLIRKEKQVAKRERKKAARDEAAAGAKGQPAPPQQKPNPHPKAQLPVTFLIDCDFDNLMSDKERKSLASQITRSYSDTRKSSFQPHLAICSFGGELKHRFDNILTHYKGWKNIRFLDDEFVSAAERAKDWMCDSTGKNKLEGSFSVLATEDSNGLGDLQNEGEVVYLTSESPYTLTALKPYSTYIIGGLVDKNREKGICYRRATEKGVKTAKLPIGEFLEMSSRKVLATNHVNEIMLQWLECGDWGEAFMKVIPKRKGGKLKGEDGDEEGDEAEVEDEHDDEGEARGGALDTLALDEKARTNGVAEGSEQAKSPVEAKE